MQHLCDANVWLALSRASHQHHELAVHWFEGLKEIDTAAFCRATQQSYLRLLTNPIITSQPPLTNREAMTGYRELRRDFRVVWLDEPKGLENLWWTYAERTTPAPKIWMDAYLAAFAQLSHARLVTFDQGFKAYKNLNWINLNKLK